MGDRLIAHGYQLSGGQKAGAGHLARYAKEGVHNHLSRWRRAGTVAYHRFRPAKNVAARLTSAERATPPEQSAKDSEPSEPAW